jgi:hypothetical protein
LMRRMLLRTQPGPLTRFIKLSFLFTILAETLYDALVFDN